MNNKKAVKAFRATFTIYPSTAQKLDRLARRHLRSRSGYLQWLIDQEHDRLFGDGSAPYAPTVAESEMPEGTQP